MKLLLSAILLVTMISPASAAWWMKDGSQIPEYALPAFDQHVRYCWAQGEAINREAERRANSYEYIEFMRYKAWDQVKLCMYRLGYIWRDPAGEAQR